MILKLCVILTSGGKNIHMFDFGFPYDTIVFQIFLPRLVEEWEVKNLSHYEDSSYKAGVRF